VEFSQGFAAGADLEFFHDGRKVLDPVSFEVLRALSSTSSIQDAVHLSGVPYRSAWEYIKNSTLALGQGIVSGKSGGHGGGRTSLTPAGRALLSLYGSVRQEQDALLHRINRQLDRDWSLLAKNDAGSYTSEKGPISLEQ
jgi:molybdate transport system regulatory protein